MNYDHFKDVLTSVLYTSDIIPEDFSFQTTTKNNGKLLNSLLIKSPDSPISPCIHLDEFYNDYKNGRNIMDILKALEEIYSETPNLPNISPLLSWDNIRSHLLIALINTSANASTLSTLPHFQILDLSLIFKVDTSFLDIPGQITINNNLLEHFEIDANTLLAEALKNSPFSNPMTLNKFSEIIPKEMYEPDCSPDMIPAFVVSTESATYGAAAVLYDEFADFLKSIEASDCYLLPSSVHEMIAMLIRDEISRDSLSELVREVNATDTVPETDFLSDNVYRYSEIKKALEELLNSAYT